MLEQILNALFYGFLIYMLTGVLFALLRSPRFYELILLVAVPLGTYHYANDFQASLMAFVFSGLFVVLAETAFQPERYRAKKLHRPIVRSSNVTPAREGMILKHSKAESRSLEVSAPPRTNATTPRFLLARRPARKHPTAVSHPKSSSALSRLPTVRRASNKR